MLIISCTWCLPLPQTIPSSFLSFYISERRPQHNKPETKGPNYLATCCQLWWLWNKARRIVQDFIPGLGSSPGEGKGYSLQYSGLEISMDCIVHGVAKSQTRLSNFHFHFISLSLIIYPKTRRPRLYEVSQLHKEERHCPEALACCVLSWQRIYSGSVGRKSQYFGTNSRAFTCNPCNIFPYILNHL